MATENKKEEPKVTCYEDEENLKKLCDFLRSSDGPAVREALLMEKRVYYLKGRSIGFFGGALIILDSAQKLTPPSFSR